MTQAEQYNAIFLSNLEITKEQLTDLKYQDSNWDSIAHMELMTQMEDTFGIELTADDIIDFSSYQKGKEILQKYGVEA